MGAATTLPFIGSAAYPSNEKGRRSALSHRTSSSCYVQARASRSAAGPFFRHVLSPTTLWMQYVVAVALGPIVMFLIPWS